MKYSINCHKDLYNPDIVFGLVKNYEKISGKTFLDTVTLRKFNYKNLFDFLSAYGLTTQWFVSKFEKAKTSPFTKVRWMEFVPIIMKQIECDRQKALDILTYIFSRMTVSNEALRKEVFFVFYELGTDYTSFEYELISEDVANFVFYVEKITEDGVRPKCHPEKIPFNEEIDSTYFKKVPSDAYVITREDKEEIEELIQSRIAIADSDDEVKFLLDFSKRFGLGVLK